MFLMPPPLDDDDYVVLSLIDAQAERLRRMLERGGEPWLESLARTAEACGIQGSLALDGHAVSMDDVFDAMAGDGVHAAVTGRVLASAYVAQVAADPTAGLDVTFIKGVHFLQQHREAAAHPGQWRAGPVIAPAPRSGRPVYGGVEADQIDRLMRALTEQVTASVTVDPVPVQAALVHLQLCLMQPFRAGNEAVARAVQSLLLARDTGLPPAFAGLEEWLGRNASEMRAAMAFAGMRIAAQDKDGMRWMKLCLKGQHQQMALHLHRAEEYEQLYTWVGELVQRESLPERSRLPLFEAALGFRVSNARYRQGQDMSEFAVSRDLRRLCEAGLLIPSGERRGRRYAPSTTLRKLRSASKVQKPLEDPYELARRNKITGKPERDIPEQDPTESFTLRLRGSDADDL